MQLCTAAYGRSCGNQQRATVHAASKANYSTSGGDTSGGEPSGETRSARSCSTHTFSTSRSHFLKSGTETTSESDLCRARPRREPLEPQVRRRHPSHQRLTQSHDHRARRRRTSTTAHGVQLHPTKQKSSPTRHQKPQNQLGSSSRDERRDPSTRMGNQRPRPTHHQQARSPSRVRPPHHMRVGNSHEPQAGVDFTAIPTERQTPALRLHGGGTINVPQLRTPRTSTKSPTTLHTAQTTNLRKTRPRTAHKTPTSKKKATTTPTATPLSAVYHKTNWKTNRSQGVTTQCAHATKQKTCGLQMESCGGSSDRAGYSPTNLVELRSD